MGQMASRVSAVCGVTKRPPERRKAPENRADPRVQLREARPAENYVVVEKYAIGYDEFKQPYVELKNGEKKKVTIKPFGREYVKVLSGLNGGEELKQLTAPAISGKNAKA